MYYCHTLARVVLLCLLCTLSSFYTILQAQNQDHSIRSIAIVRGDGIVSPFGIYSAEGGWQPLEMSDFYDLEYEQPEWYFQPEPDSLRILATGTPVVYDPDGMNSGYGFLSSLPVEGFGSNNVFPRHKLGIAFSWDHPHIIFEPVEKEQLAEGIKSLMKDSLVARENDFLKSDDASWLPDIPRNESERDSISIRVSAIATKEMVGDVRVSFVSSTRRYPDCGPIFDFQGWVIESGEDAYFIKNDFGIGDCDGKMLPPTIKPHVAFHMNDKLYVGAEVWLYEGEEYRLFEIGPKGEKILIDSRPGH